jgi:type I restriction enzyme S subunit
LAIVFEDNLAFKQTAVGKIPIDWDVVSVKDVCSDIFSGGTPSTQRAEYWNGGINWLSSGETGQTFIRGTEKKISQIGVENSSTRIAKVNDIVVASAGQGYTRGQAAFCLIDTFVNQSVVVLRSKKEEMIPLFLFYNILSRYDELRQISDAFSSRGSLTTKLLASLSIQKPSIREQEKIGRILSQIDFKIELNQEMNCTLETVGQALFKRWFVDFEFPNQEVKPYKSSGGEMIESELGYIPKDWIISSFGKVLSLLKDGTHTPPKQRAPSGIRFIAGASDVEHFEIDFTNCTFITESDYKSIHKYWELAEKDVLLTIVGTVGNVAIVKETDLPFSLQRSLAILRAGEKISYVYLYFLLNSQNFKRFLLSRINQTAQPGIYLGTLSSFELVLPPKELIEKFTHLIEPLVIKMMNNNENSHTLSNIRDKLLPKLMSGKIRVPIVNKMESQ